MKITIEQGNIVLTFTPMIFLSTINEWKREETEPVSFDFINVYFYKDQYLDQYDLGVIFFGLGLSLKINYFDKEDRITGRPAFQFDEELEKAADEVKKIIEEEEDRGEN